MRIQARRPVEAEENAVRRLVRESVRGVVLTACVFWSVPVGAQAGSPHHWDSLSPEQKGRARDHYRDFQRLPEQDRQRVEDRYRRWQQLAPEQQQLLRRNYGHYEDLDPAERRQFDEGYQRWKSREAGEKRGK